MKKTLAFLTALLAVCSVSAAAFTPETPESGREASVASDAASLSACTPYTPKAIPFEETVTDPDLGVLVFKQDFEGETAGTYYYDDSLFALGTGLSMVDGNSAGAGVAIVEDPWDTESGNHALKVDDSKGGWPAWMIGFNGKLSGRSGILTYKQKTTGNASGGFVRLRDGNANAFNYNISSTGWKNDKYAMNLVTSEEAAVSTSQTRFANMGYIFIAFGAGSSDGSKYYIVDDIEVWFKEYARVNFHFDCETEGVADAAASSVMASQTFAPGAPLPEANAAGTSKHFVGWSTEAGNASKIITHVPSKAGVYDLYAIYEDGADVGLTISAKSIAAGSGTVTVTKSSDAAVFSFDAGYSDATYTVEGNTMTINVGQKAGEVVVTAALEGGVSRSVKLAIYNSKVVMPGLNMLNGLPAPVDFENGLTYGFSGAVSYGDENHEIDGRKTSALCNTKTGITGESYYSQTINLKFEQGRRYTFTADVYRDSGATDDVSWLLDFNGSGSHITFGSPYTGHWRTMSNNALSPAATKTGVSFQNKIATNGAFKPTVNVYWDNMAVYAWYKVTYHMPDNTTVTVDVDPTLTSFTSDKTLPSTSKDDCYHHFLGWSKTENAATGSMTIELDHNGDFDLYPVFEDVTEIAGRALIDPVKGYLVYFNDFETGATSPNYVNTNIFTGSPYFGGEMFVSTTVVNNPVTEGNDSAKVLDLCSSESNAAYRFFRFSFGNGNNKNGKITGEFDTMWDDAILSNYSYMEMRSGETGFTSSGIALPATREANVWMKASGTMSSYGSANFQFGPHLKAQVASHLYYDNAAFYVFPNDEIFLYDAETERYKTFAATEGNITFPTPASIGFEDEDFIIWRSLDGSKAYRAGETVAAADCCGKTYAAFYQDASMPAMGFAYEMNSKANSVGAGTSGLERITATYGITDSNGRTWARFGNNKNSQSDPRTTLTGLSVDASEYYIYQSIETSYREGDATQVLHFLPQGGSYSCTADSTHIFSKSIPGNTETVIEIDFSKSNYKEHFWGYGANWTLGQLWIQPDQTSLNFDPNTLIWDVDYFRLYRGGYTTVSYYDGDTLLWQDENRGVGTGYLFRGTIPTKNGYVFKGWSLDGSAVVESFDLTGDTSVYAVWEIEESVSPETSDEIGYCTGAVSGIRFKASVTADQYEDTDVLEYGFIISRAAILAKCGMTDDYSGFTKDTVYSAGQPALFGKTVWVGGAALDRANGIDKKYSTGDDGSVCFTAVTTGIPDDMLDDVLVARPYMVIKVTDGKNITVYGDVKSSSVNEAMGN